MYDSIVGSSDNKGAFSIPRHAIVTFECAYIAAKYSNLNGNCMCPYYI